MICARMYGQSVRNCSCFLPNEAGFTECPPEARGLLGPAPEPLEAGFRTEVAAEAVLAYSGPAPAAASYYEGHAWNSPPPLNHGLRIANTGIRAAAPAKLAAPNLSTLAGEFCENCGSPNVRRTGTCLQCLDCYHAGGCG